MENALSMPFIALLSAFRWGRAQPTATRDLVAGILHNGIRETEDNLLDAVVITYAFAHYLRDSEDDHVEAFEGITQLEQPPRRYQQLRTVALPVE